MSDYEDLKTDYQDAIDEIDELNTEINHLKTALHIKREPLFVSPMNAKGQIVIIEWVRKHKGLNAGDRIAVYSLERDDK